MLIAAVVAIALLPIALATARAIHRGWLPVGDNGLMYTRAADVFSHRPPLLGIWSYGSTSAKSVYNHPGPLLYDLFAVPTALFGLQGLAIAAALLNSAALVGVAIVGRRLGGPILALGAVAAAAALCWTMGSALLFDPWTPNSLLLLFLLFLMLTWATSSGDLIAFPVMIGVGSVLVETNLGYALLVVALSAWAVLGLALQLRQRRSGEPGSWAALRSRAAGTGAVAVVTFVLCWAQPVIEQFTSTGPGNMTLIARGLPTITHTLGLGTGVRLLAGVVAVPPWWLRPSMEHVYTRLPSQPVAVLCLGVVAALLGWFAFDARRRRDRVISTAVTTAAIATVVGLVTAMQSPVYGTNFQPYETRFLWPLAVFLTLVVVIGLGRQVLRIRSPRALPALLAVGTTLIVILNLPWAPAHNRTHAPDLMIPVMMDLDHQIGSLKNHGTLLVHFDQGEQPLYPLYLSSFLAELRHRHVPFVLDDEVLIRSLGEDRRFTGRNAREVVRIRTGDRARVGPIGATRVALHEGLNATERDEFAKLKNEIAGYISSGGLHLTDRGDVLLRRLAAATGHPRQRKDSFDATQLLGRSRSLLSLFANGFLALDPDWASRIGRYDQLQTQSDQRTVAVFAAPIAINQPGPTAPTAPA